jgi:hypothetical protein
LEIGDTAGLETCATMSRQIMATMQSTVFRHSRRDALLVIAAGAHGLVLLLWPSMLLVALGLWWCANTVSHNFIHLPFFRSRAANSAFSIYLSLLLGLPQTLWRQRHLAHHAERTIPLRMTRLLLCEILCVTILWATIAAFSPQFFLASYLPGWLLGLTLCQLQGHYEHARGTTSHYGWFYNFLFFNDGYHVEHHQKPAHHWSELPRVSKRLENASRWPAVLRWLDGLNLEGLERAVLRSRFLQRLVVRLHERAFRKLLANIPRPDHIAIVGGALFPRTAILLQRLAPQACIVVIDCNPRHIEVAHQFLNGSVTYEQRMFDSSASCDQFDAVVLPLSFRGDRDAICNAPPARALLVHDWIWRKRGHQTARISWLLLKRLNLVLR